MKYCCIVLILVGVYVVSGLFDYPLDSAPWFYGIHALWSTLNIIAVIVCETSFRSSNIYSLYLSLYIIFLEFSAVCINFLAILFGLGGDAFFYLYFDSMMETITVLEFIGLLSWILLYGIFNGLFIYHTTRLYCANIYRHTDNISLFYHRKSH